jgi:hypothetical protein
MKERKKQRGKVKAEKMRKERNAERKNILRG